MVVSNGSGDVVNNLGGAGFAGHLGDGVNSGGTVNLGDDVASLNRGNYFFDDGNINAMFGFDLSAGSFDGLGDRGGDGNGVVGEGSDASITSIGETSMEKGNSGFGISLSFTFDNKTMGSNMSAVFVDNLFASVQIIL